MLEQACVVGGDCVSDECLNGKCIPPAAAISCKEILSLDPDAGSGIYDIDPDGLGGEPPFDAYCDMETMGGGWTMALKARGDMDTFVYSSALWTNTDTHEPSNTGLDRTETKLVSYSTMPFTQLLLGFEAPIKPNGGLALQYQVLDIVGDSLFSVIEPDVHVPSGVSKPSWLSLISGSALQINCDREGINARKDGLLGDFHRVRIGIISNGEDNCDTPDSRLGIGGEGSTGIDAPGPSVGNAAGDLENNDPDVELEAFALVFVR
jgi:hypothetical protein